MCQILHASFWKFSKLPNIGISLNWSITDEVTTRNTTAYFFGPFCDLIANMKEMNERKCGDLKCVQKPTRGRLSLTHLHEQSLSMVRSDW